MVITVRPILLDDISQEMTIGIIVDGAIVDRLVISYEEI